MLQRYDAAVNYEGLNHYFDDKFYLDLNILVFKLAASIYHFTGR